MMSICERYEISPHLSIKILAVRWTVRCIHGHSEMNKAVDMLSIRNNKNNRKYN